MASAEWIEIQVVYKNRVLQNYNSLSQVKCVYLLKHRSKTSICYLIYKVVLMAVSYTHLFSRH